MEQEKKNSQKIMIKQEKMQGCFYGSHVLDQMYEEFSDLQLLSPDMIFFILDKIGSVTAIYASKFSNDTSDFVEVNALSDDNIEL